MCIHKNGFVIRWSRDIMSSVMNSKVHLQHFIPLLSIPAAFLLPAVGQQFAPHTQWILAAMLFFSFLGFRIADIRHLLRRPLRSVAVIGIILVVTPLVFYPLSGFLDAYATGAMLFMLLPSAISSPAVAALYGGEVVVATLDAVVTNLLSVATIPIFFSLVLHETIAVSAWAILQQMAVVILIPFAISSLISHFFPHMARKIHHHFKIANLVLLFFLIFGILSPNVTELRANILNSTLILSVLFTTLVLWVVARLTARLVKKPDEATSIFCNTLLLNTGLGAVLAQNYFGPNEVLFIVFCNIVWVLLVGIVDKIK